MIRDFINKIVTNQQVQIDELNHFIVDYCKLMEVKEPNLQEIQQIAQLIQFNMMDLRYAVIKAAKKLNLEIYTLSDVKTSQIIKQYINENNQSSIQPGE